MCPALVSTTTPSGSRPSVTRIFLFDPSVLTEKIRPPLRSSTYRRPFAKPFVFVAMSVLRVAAATRRAEMDGRLAETPAWLVFHRSIQRGGMDRAGGARLRISECGFRNADWADAGS